jgi:hypothetical protein
MRPHNHDDDWKRPLRRSRERLYESPDSRRSFWVEPPPPATLGEAWEARVRERNRLGLVEQELAAQRKRLETLETRGAPCQMEIHTFAPEPYQVKKPIPVLVRSHEGEFIASFMDANVNASGETEQEAFEAVKVLMLDMLDQLVRQPKLGPKLATRLAVLREFIDGP